MSSKDIKVLSLDHLRELCKNPDGEEFAIQLNYGLISRKRMWFNELDSMWFVHNYIDDSEQEIPENLLGKRTNIVKALKKGALYCEVG